MSVTVTIDIGTSVVPLALPDAAVAYAIQYEAGNTATLFIRFLTEPDVEKKLSPSAVFQGLVKKMPGVWNPTYANLDSLLTLEPLKKEYQFYAVKLVFDEKEYSWRIEIDAVREWLMNFQLGRTPEMSDKGIVDISNIKF